MAIVNIFLKSDYWIDVINYIRMTPLHIASRDNSSGCVEELLLNGADPLIEDMFMNIPIHYAALNGNSKIISMLLNNDKSLSVKLNSKQETPLFLASREGHTDVVAMLLQTGIVGLTPDLNGRTPLHRSAARGHFEIVKLLRHNLANKDLEDKWGFTALSYAASWKGHQDIIGFLETSLINMTLSAYLEISNPF